MYSVPSRATAIDGSPVMSSDSFPTCTGAPNWRPPAADAGAMRAARAAATPTVGSRRDGFITCPTSSTPLRHALFPTFRRFSGARSAGAAHLHGDELPAAALLGAHPRVRPGGDPPRLALQLVPGGEPTLCQPAVLDRG